MAVASTLIARSHGHEYMTVPPSFVGSRSCRYFFTAFLSCFGFFTSFFRTLLPLPMTKLLS
jgi:hypothetical protein